MNADHELLGGFPQFPCHRGVCSWTPRPLQRSCCFWSLLTFSFSWEGGGAGCRLWETASTARSVAQITSSNAVVFSVPHPHITSCASSTEHLVLKCGGGRGEHGGQQQHQWKGSYAASPVKVQRREHLLPYIFVPWPWKPKTSFAYFPVRSELLLHWELKPKYERKGLITAHKDYNERLKAEADVLF